MTSTVETDLFGATPPVDQAVADPRDDRPSGDRTKLRVLHVITHLDHGGAQDNTLLTVAGMDRDRYTVDIAGGPGVLEDRARDVADNVFILNSLRRPLADSGAIRTYRELRALCANYDIVHTHGSKAGVLGRFAARARRVPVIVHTVHGMPVNEYMGAAQRRLLISIERAAARHAHRIICVCQNNADESLALRIAKPDNVRVVVSGVEASAISSGDGGAFRAELGIPAGAPIVGSITRLMEQKAPLDLIAALRIVLDRRPDAHAVVVGEGPLEAEVRAAATGEQRLHILGYREDIPDLVDAIDVVAYSSLWEGLGRALTETVLAGKPVVATAVNGVPDLVVEGVTGHLVPPRRPEMLAERVLDVLALPDRGRTMGQAGASRVAGDFDVSDMVAGIDAVYQECLPGQEPRRDGTRT